jgi:hypothetical protein
MQFVVSSRRIVRAMLLAALILTFASLAGELSRITRNWRKETLLDMVLTPLEIGADSSIPTWYSSIALLMCSVLLATIAATKKRQGEGYATHWGVLSAIFLMLSIDEVARIHETVGDVIYSLANSVGFTPSGFIYYVWVVPGAVFVLVVLLVYVRFLLHLPKRTLLLFLVAGGVFVVGAIGVEMLGSRLVFENVVQSRGSQNASGNTRVMIVVAIAIEELLEMLGIVIFVYALLSYMGFAAKEVTLRIRPDNEL